MAAALTSYGGLVYWAGSSDAWGDHQSSTASYPQNRRDFAATSGYERNDAGVLDVGIRAYDSELGRFLQLDPLGDGYRYCANSPTNAVDPSGASLTRSPGSDTIEEAPPKPTLGEAFLQCGLQQAGVFLDGVDLLVLGAPLIPKPFVTPGSSPNTSIIRIALPRIGLKLGRSIWAPTLTNLLSRTGSVTALVGRWVPWVGGVMAAWAAYQIGKCMYDMLN